MPINCTVSVSREIKSLLFVNDGSLHVVLVRHENGDLVGEESHRIEPEQAAGMLDADPLPGLTVRQQIVLSVYQHLVTSGMVAGEVVAA